MRLHWQKECNYSVNCNLCLFVPQIVAYLGVNKKKKKGVIKGGKFKNVIKQKLQNWRLNHSEGKVLEVRSLKNKFLLVRSFLLKKEERRKEIEALLLFIHNEYWSGPFPSWKRLKTGYSGTCACEQNVWQGKVFSDTAPRVWDPVGIQSPGGSWDTRTP